MAFNEMKILPGCVAGLALFFALIPGERRPTPGIPLEQVQGDPGGSSGGQNKWHTLFGGSNLNLLKQVEAARRSNVNPSEQGETVWGSNLNSPEQGDAAILGPSS